MNFSILSKRMRQWFSTNLANMSAIIFFHAILIGTMWSSIFVILRTDRANTTRDAIARNNTLAIAFEQYTTRIIENADMVVRDLLLDHARDEEKLNLVQFVAEHRLGNPALVGVTITNERGDARFVAASASSVGATNMADRAHFRVHINRDSGKAFIGQPIIGRLTGKTIIPITRRINNRDGTFGGMAMVSIEPSIFTDFLHDAKPSPQDVISIIGLDGVTRARMKGTTVSSGEDIRKGPFFAEVSKGDRVGSILAKGTLDGVSRFFSFRILPNYELVCTVGTSEAEVMAEFNRRRSLYFRAAGLASVFITGVAVLMMLALANRTRAETTVRRLAAIVEFSNDAIIGMDMSGVVTSWNAGAERLFGYAAAEMVGQPILRLIPLERHDEETKILDQIARGETVRHFETVRRHKAGSALDVSVSFSGIKDGAGKLVGASKTIRDLTGRKRAEQRQQRSEANLAASQRIAHLGSWEMDLVSVQDLTQGALRWSDEVFRIWGYEPRAIEVTYENFLAAVHPDDRSLIGETVSAALRDSRPYDLNHRILRPDGTERIVRELAEFQFEEGTGRPLRMIGTVMDITEQSRAEAALRELALRLLRAEDDERRRIAKELHDSTAQDLVAVLLNLGTLRDALPELAAEPEQILEDSVALLENSANDIRTLSYALHPPRLDEMGLAGGLAEYAAGLSKRAGVRIHVEAEPDFGRLPENIEHALFRVAQESLSNVVRHSQSDTAIVRLARQGANLVLEIEDHGRGLPLDLVTRTGARGVGLAGMRERMQHLGGWLELTSGPRGTTVRAVLPGNGDQK